MDKKVVLLGPYRAGKTSMRSIIFANYIAQDTARLGPTVNLENSHVKFLGNLNFSLWDCSGQYVYMESYTTSQREYIFSNVEVLIYVLDVTAKDPKLDIRQYQATLEAIKECSPKAKVFCLIHKMDLIPADQRQQVFNDKEAYLRSFSGNLVTHFFQTSIWDETLYKAWSSIVYSLIPNAKELQERMDKFCELTESDEVVLFEKATFLVISHSDSSPKKLKDGEEYLHDPHRFEKISNIIKQFKLSCSKISSQFKSMQVRNSNFSAFIDEFTANTYIMVITYDTSIHSGSTLINISSARKHFEPLVTNK